MSRINLSWYIKKYGEEEGKRRFDNRKNTINTLEWYVNNFGEDEGKRRYDDELRLH